jgi:cytoplasmic iron level regulating protein YaaA (DUF328/UPF0246 family)
MSASRQVRGAVRSGAPSRMGAGTSLGEVIVLLPPSETKRAGGDGPPLALDGLSWPELTALRAELVTELVELAADPAECRRALSISPAQDAEIARNAMVRSAPTLPALRRYTGVLYDALDVESLRGAAATRARARLAVGSALFGLLRADDLIPAYRMSAGSKLPGRPGLPARWRPVLEPVLAEVCRQELVVDLRSGAYVGLGRLAEAVRVDVLAAHPDGRRTAVSHFNKSHKGRLARALASAITEPDDAAAVAAVARRAGMRVEHDDQQVTIVVAA